jgi:hypothetical protein
MAAEAAFKDVPEIFEVTIHEIISSHASIQIPA